MEHEGGFLFRHLSGSCYWRNIYSLFTGPWVSFYSLFSCLQSFLLSSTGGWWSRLFVSYHSKGVKAMFSDEQ